jgi:esterase/lipase superfamily enzyme
MTTIYFATNRLLDESKGEFTEAFHPNVDELRFGSAALDGKDLFKIADTKLAPKVRISVEPERLNPGNPAASKLGSLVIFDEIREAMRKAGRGILFIHGYNFNFRDSVARAVQMKQWLEAGGQDAAMLLFAWPGLGQGVNGRTYSDERARAAASGLALARAMLKATDYIRTSPKGERCDAPIHLLAHSMGNWTLRGAIQAMRTYVGYNIPPLFEEVLLMAADEDDDTLALNHKMAPLLRGCRRVTVYYNHQDVALKGSDVAMGNPDRLGRSGPKDVRSVAKIVPVNVSPVIDWDSGDWAEDDTGHQYYRSNKTVRDDVVQVLEGKLDSDIKGRKRKDDAFYRLG